MRIRAWLAACVLAGGIGGPMALAQTLPPPSAALPDPNAVPLPGNTRLPGVDPRTCGTTKWSALCAAGRWLQFSTITVRMTTPTGFAGDYTLEQAANGEMHATYLERAHAQRRGGEVVLIGGEGIAFRTRDELPPPDSIIDHLLSGALIQTRLVAALLDLGVLGPPSDVTQKQAISASSTTQYLRAEAPRTALLFGPPWQLTGTVQPAANAGVAFALKLRYRPVDRKGVPIVGKSDTIELNGTVSFDPQRTALPESLDLTGWKLMRREEMLPGAATLGEARGVVGM